MFVVADEAREEAPKLMFSGVTRAPWPAPAVALSGRGRVALHYFEINVGPPKPRSCVGRDEPYWTGHTERATRDGLHGTGDGPRGSERKTQK